MRRVKTGVVLLNLGGPASQRAVKPFLHRLFSDRELIRLPLQRISAPLIATLRAPKVRKLYASIGGGSPLAAWTDKQGEGMVRHLDRLSPATAPHAFYPAFRYVEPFIEHALDAMARDRVEHAVAFSQYPQWSCTTTGSALNELWRQQQQKASESVIVADACHRQGMAGKFKWTVVDRFWQHESFLGAVVERIREGLAKVPADVRDQTPVLFSAHSIPMMGVEKGDSYPSEISSTSHAIMQRLKIPNPFVVCYQSAVGPAAWLGPRTEATIKGLAKQKLPAVFVVPIAFTSDHIETLRELDIDYKGLAESAGIGFYRMESLNDSASWLRAMADIVNDQMRQSIPHSTQYPLRCIGCTNDVCKPPITGTQGI